MDCSFQRIIVNPIFGFSEIQTKYEFIENAIICFGRRKDTDEYGNVTYNEWSECGRVECI